jgi:asparagine N-glycosylation enzyme membrane subunit Stt3
VNESMAQGYAAALVVSQSPIMTSIPLEALGHYRLVHESDTAVTSSGQKYVKIFEHVPGATITGNASPGTEVVISVPITTNRGRTFEYRQSNVADSDGKFSLVVPYSTEGPVDWSTNFDTGPLGPYTLRLGSVQYDVRVPEGAVITGSSIEI